MEKLVVELTEKFKKAKKDAEKVETNGREQTKSVFIYPTNDGMINPRYISPLEYNQLVEFEAFLKAHEELTIEQINNVLALNEDFVFLNKLRTSMPNFVVDLKAHGAKAVALIYVSDKLYPNKTK